MKATKNLKDRQEAIEHLNEAMKKEPHIFLEAFREVVEAQRDFENLAKKAHLNTTRLTNALSGRTVLKWNTVLSICKSLGFTISFISLDKD